MSSYTNTFTGAPVQISPTSYRRFFLNEDTTLSWSQYDEDNGNVVADVMEIESNDVDLSLLMPPANQISEGKASLVRNLGSISFNVKTNTGVLIQNISPGQTFWIYVTNNSSVSGVWSSFQFGTGTSSADANTLAGNGLTAISTTLNVDLNVNQFNSNFTLSSNYRASFALWTGGVGAFNFSPAATLTDGWFILIKNSGSGALTLDPDGSELIDGQSTATLDVGESAIIACNGTTFYTLCKNDTVTISFTRLVKSVAGSTDITLTTAEAGYDVQEYTGALTGNINVIVPTAVSRWWVYNNTSGAFSLTVKTSAGTGIAVPQGTRQILHCDGTNVVKSVDSGSGTVTSVATGTGLTGGPITSTGTIALANTAVSPGSYGTVDSSPSITVDAQGRLTAASNVSIVETSIASAATTNIGASTTSKVLITGTTTITAFDTVASGIVRQLRFQEALTLTHNATSLILPTTNNITTAANDTAVAMSLGSGNWIILSYNRASGLPLITVPPSLGGTGSSSLTLNNVLLGNGTSPVQTVAPGTSGNLLTSNGTTWQSSSPNRNLVANCTYSGATSGSGGVTFSNNLNKNRTGTGTYDFTFLTSQPDTNYQVFGNGVSSTSNKGLYFEISSKTTSGFTLTIWTVFTATQQDPTTVDIAVFRF